MRIINFYSEDLKIDYLSLNLQFNDLRQIQKMAGYLGDTFGCKSTLLDQSTKLKKTLVESVKRNYSASFIINSTKYWRGTTLCFKGNSAQLFYEVLKLKKLDWTVFDLDSTNLGRIDLCFSRPNDWSHTSKSFDAFLVDSRSQIQDHTNTKYIKLEDFPNGKMLKVNRRNNSRHYRVYQRDETARFELELKHRQTKLVQDYLFENQLDVFEHQLVIQYFQYSDQVLRSDYSYTDWVVDFQRRHHQLVTVTSRSLIISYLENRVIKNQEEEERLFHLLQFLSFMKSLKLNPLKDCQKYRIKKQFYYVLKFPLSQFVKFTGMKLSHQSEREKLIFYFYQLQKLDPLVKVFSNMAFRSYVCFPYVDCANPSGKSWVIEVLAAEELFCFPYPFQLSKSFLRSESKNDLRLKVRLIKSLAVSDQKKRLYLEEFFNTINVRNDPLNQIKKNIIQLLSELVEIKIIQNEVEVVLKSGKKKYHLIKNLTTSDITRRIKYIQLHEILPKIG
jgi:hypothetical protein